ncbi:MAG: GAF domain-containing protein [Coleofasciculaceae cyanobacterium]
MKIESNSAYEYKVGGSLAADALSYVRRKADEELYHNLKEGTFCYVLNSRQMGKSSLRVQTMVRLQAEDIHCAAIDLTKIITNTNIDSDKFYAGITYTLAKSFNIFTAISEFNAWWRDYELLNSMQRLDRFIQEVILTDLSLLKKNIVIFIDEVDSILRLPFSVNDFFALIRACHDNRADQPEYNRLTFAILGVASPSDLITGKNHSPPFNFGKAVELKGFQLQEAKPIEKGLKNKYKYPKRLLKSVLIWTGGQPFLTQKLCKLIIEAEDLPSTKKEAEWVERLVQKRILENWESQDEPEHLKTIRDRLLRSEDSRIELLKLYRQILLNDEIAADDSSEQMQLRLSGLVVKHNSQLKIRNRIYECVFSLDWIEKVLTALSPQSAESEYFEFEFCKTLDELERKLLASQLANVAEDYCSDQALYEALREITFQIGDLLNADRATIFLLNEAKTELWSIVAKNDNDKFLDIQVRLGEGIAGEVAKTKQVINIIDVYEDSRSSLAKEYDKKFNYYTSNVLAYPILSETNEVIAVIQFLNKLKQPKTQNINSHSEIEINGFTELDQNRLAKFVPTLRRILESCQSCYKTTKKLRATAALAEATRSLDKSSLDTKEILRRVMDEAQKLMNADRSTLWLVDQDLGDLWTEIPGLGEKRCQFGVGFAGQVAQSRETMVIPFDLYDHPGAINAKNTDQETGYRTCSLLCMPVLNPDGQLLGVTQLLNKRKPGDFPEYNPNDWPKAPDQFKASFDENDRQSMQVFNERAGVILQYAKTHEKLKQLTDIKPQEAIYNTLDMLSSAVGNQSDENLYNALHSMLNFVSTSISKLLGADCTTIFLFNAEQNELFSIIEDGANKITEIKISANHNLINKFFSSSHENVIYKNSHSLSGKFIPLKQIASQQIGKYPVHNLLLFSLRDRQGNITAIFEFLNKLKSPNGFLGSLAEGIEANGFNPKDAERLEQRVDSILPIVEGFQTFYKEIKTIQSKREIDALWLAINSVSQGNLNPKKLLQQVMEAAKKLTNADRSTLWLVDRERGDLWTELPGVGEKRCQIGVGFAGKVAASCEPIIIPFDLYDYLGSEIAKKTDKETGYRTCSLLCMPVFNPNCELVGVTQLLNKTKNNNRFFISKSNLPLVGEKSQEGEDKDAIKEAVPDQFRDSFNERDKRYMEIFNNQVGVVVQEAQQQDILRREILKIISRTSKK